MRFNSQGFYRILGNGSLTLRQVLMKPLYRHFVKALLALLLCYAGNASAFTLIPLPDEEDLAPSNTVTDADTLETQVQPVTSAVGTHLQGVFRGLVLPEGGGAGAGDSGFQGVWVNSSYTRFENSFTRTRFDGASELLLAGFDFSLSENFLYGLALGSERGDIDTTFNMGNQETKGAMITPYLGWLISDNWSFDLSLGSSDIDTQQFRTEIVTTIDASAPPTLLITQLPETVRSKFSSKRDFTAANINGFWANGDWHFGARLGYVSVTNKQDRYTETDDTVVEAAKFELKQTQFGGDIGYGSQSQVYLGAVMMRDSSSETVEFTSGEQPPDDADSLLISAGWRYYGKDGVSALLELNTRDGKEKYSEDTVLFTLRCDFD